MKKLMSILLCVLGVLCCLVMFRLTDMTKPSLQKETIEQGPMPREIYVFDWPDLRQRALKGEVFVGCAKVEFLDGPDGGVDIYLTNGIKTQHLGSPFASKHGNRKIQGFLFEFQRELLLFDSPQNLKFIVNPSNLEDKPLPRINIKNIILYNERR